MTMTERRRTTERKKNDDNRTSIKLKID